MKTFHCVFQFLRFLARPLIPPNKCLLPSFVQHSLALSYFGHSGVLFPCGFHSNVLWQMCRLFSKRPKAIFMLYKNKLCHKGNWSKISGFYVYILLLTSWLILTWLVSCQAPSWLEIVWGLQIFMMFRRQRFTNAWSLDMMSFVTNHISHPFAIRISRKNSRFWLWGYDGYCLLSIIPWAK
jgi:hypothetical protein